MGLGEERVCVCEWPEVVKTWRTIGSLRCPLEGWNPRNVTNKGVGPYEKGPYRRTGRRGGTVYIRGYGEGFTGEIFRLNFNVFQECGTWGSGIIDKIRKKNKGIVNSGWSCDILNKNRNPKEKKKKPDLEGDLEVFPTLETKQNENKKWLPRVYGSGEGVYIFLEFFINNLLV